MKRQISGITLMELIIAIVLISFVIIGLASIDLFSRFHVTTSDRRAKMQNRVSYVLEHMSKEAVKTIGNSAISGQEPVNLEPIGGDTSIKFYVDLADDGTSPGDGRRETQGDRWIAYRYRSSALRRDRYQLWYCPNCTNPPFCTQCSPDWNTLSANITAFTPTYISGNNYVEADITACWDPDGTPYPCGTPDNPSVTMRNRIKMPSVSTN